MRQIVLQMPAGAAEGFADDARSCGAVTYAHTRGQADGVDIDLVVLTAPNRAVSGLLGRAREHGRVLASMPSAGALAFEPPADEAPPQLLDVSARSPLEVVLIGMQASGSWLAYLLYAGLAAAVAWLGLFTETAYLLVGAMLIAPFAEPAMNTAIAIASGRSRMLGHAVARYLVGVGVTAAAAASLTWLGGQQLTTDLMASVMTITLAAVLLPVAAGVAGALFLVQGEHSSLISGAAVGVLVAASLAPPAAGIGVALTLARPDLALHGAFLVALQLTGITASALVVLWLYGVRPGRTGYGSTRSWLLPIGAAVDRKSVV